MKIALSILSRNEEVLCVRRLLESLGHEVCMLSLDPFETHCSYVERKLAQLGFHGLRRRFDMARLDAHLDVLSNWQPDRLFFLNLPDDVFSYEQMQAVRKAAQKAGCPLCAWIVDICKRSDALLDFCRLFDSVASYEKADAEWLFAHGIPARFLPLGYSEVYAEQETCFEKEQDILFIGTPYRSRLHLLEQVALQACEEGWKLRVIGPLWAHRYPWKKLQFRLRYPALYPCVENRVTSPEEAARLYAASRICLNLHHADAKGCNPRTYEILAVGGFELVDQREDYDILRPGQDLVSFTDAYDLLRKIRYYLIHDEERRMIGEKGQNSVLGIRSRRTILGDLMGGIP